MIIYISLLLLLPNFSFGDIGKIDPEVVNLLEQDSDVVDVIINLRNGDTKPVLNSLMSRMSAEIQEDPATVVYSELRDFAYESQRHLLSRIRQKIRSTSTRSRIMEPTVKSFWISNSILIKGADKKLLNSISNEPDIEMIELTPHVFMTGGNIKNSGIKKIDCDGTDAYWGMERVKALKVWSHPNGTWGKGVVVGVIDTGVHLYHEMLKDNYVGEYGWREPLREKPTYPWDWDSHGTHVAGLAVGSVASGIGVAPGANWMACKFTDPRGDMKFEGVLACMEFMLCPTLADGSNPKCSRKPHVINNSWAAWKKGSNVIANAVSAWRAANIIPVFAIGNDGDECEKNHDPVNVETICVGNMEINNSLAISSSRGPSKKDGSVKPDVIAPGMCIWSSGVRSNDDYFYNSGSSMSSPYVTGVIALLLSTKPNLTFDQIYKAITKTANNDIILSAQTCGGISEKSIPNNQIGYGLIDAYEAYNYVLKHF